MLKYDICVIGGAGHVGLPLSIAFAEKGKSVVIFDINKAALDVINKGEMPFREEGCVEKLKKVLGKNLRTSSDNAVISQAKFVVVVIGTPVDEHLNPTFHDMKLFFESIVGHLKNEQIVILRSTVFPGISEKVRILLKEKLPGIEVCFCPERILEGANTQQSPIPCHSPASTSVCLLRSTQCTTPWCGPSPRALSPRRIRCNRESVPPSATDRFVVRLGG